VPSLCKVERWRSSSVIDAGVVRLLIDLESKVVDLMQASDIELMYIPEVDAWEIQHVYVELLTQDDARTFHHALLGAVERMAAHAPLDLIVSLDCVYIAQGVADEFGKTVRSLLEGPVRFIVRYGTGESVTRASVRLQAIQSGFPSNIFPTREDALRGLEHLRAAAAEPSVSS